MKPEKTIDASRNLLRRRAARRPAQFVEQLLLTTCAALLFSGFGSRTLAQSSEAKDGTATTGSKEAAAANGNPNSDAGHDAATRDYLSGNGLLNRGLFDLAAGEYRKFLAAHPDHEKASLAHYGLGVSLFRLGQFEPALGELAPLQGLTDFPFAAEVGTICGQCLLSLHRYDDAAAAFEQVVSRSPEHALADDAAAGAIEALFQGGKPDAVISKCQEFVRRFADSALRERVEYLWALAAISKSESAAAIERLNYLLEHYPKSPLCDHATFLLAQSEQATGQTEKAVADYRRVLSKSDTAYAAESLLALGTLLRSQNQLAGAGDALDRFLEKFPTSKIASKAKLERGLVYFDEGKFDRAEGLLDPLAASDDELADEAAYWAAKCRFRQSQFADAAKLLGEAIARFSKSPLVPEMLYDRGVALLRADAPKEAVAALSDFRAKFPQHALLADATQLLALTKHQQKQYDESDKLCGEFLSKFPDHALTPTILFLSGENEFLSGKFADAITRYRDLLTRYTSDSRAVTAGYRIGISLYRLERFDEAEPLLAKLAPLAAKDEMYRPALLALGDVYVRRGDWKNAEQSLSEFLNGGMEAASADDALMKLALAKERQDRALDALADYTKLVERFPKSPYRIEAMFEQGQILLAKDRLDEAASMLERVVADGGNSPFVSHARQHLAAIAMQQQKFDRAAELYAQAAASSPGDSRAAGTANPSDGETDRVGPDDGALTDSYFGQAEALMAGGKFAEAEKAFTAYLMHAPNGPRVPEARARLAIVIAREDRPADALTAMDALGSSIATLSADLRSAMLYEKAWCLRSLKRTDEALAVYRVLADNAAGGDLRLHAMLELSELQSSNRQFDSAAEMLRRLREILATGDTGQKHADLAEQAAYRLAVCEFELTHYDAAAAQFDQFLNDFPKSSLTPAACFYSGESLFRLQRFDAAVERLTRLTRDYATDPLGASGFLRLGECEAALQRWSQSEEAYKSYLQHNGDGELWYQARFGVGWARENQKRHDDAMTSYRDVVARHQGPTAARAQFQIGECLFAEGKYEDATAELLKVDILYAFPEWSAAALYEAGRCFEKLQKPVEARAQFRAVAERYKDTNWAPLAEKRISELTSASAAPGS